VTATRPADTIDTLRTGDLQVEGRLVDASNATLYCRVRANATVMACIYKPQAGERPLWDFPTGTLSHREVAAYIVSEALGWGIVPPTVWRSGPFGPGMVQEWIEVDETVDLVGLVRSEHHDLRRMAVFDFVINNADRKGGHVLPTVGGALYGIDHGVSFATDDKVRTLLWQWEGQEIPSPLLTDLESLVEQLQPGPLLDALTEHLARGEVQAIRRRTKRLLKTSRHPSPSPDWPAIPWPPF